jgi:hypothetical protein
MDSIGKSSKSKSSKSSKSKSNSNKSRSKSKSPKEYPITESRKFPKFPKNAVFPDSEYAKTQKRENSHHSVNPIKHWPPSRKDVTAANVEIACNDHSLPQRIRTHILELRGRNIRCVGVSLMSNGVYVIAGHNGYHYAVGEELGYGKKKGKSKKNKSKSKSKKSKSKKNKK